jgi:hypothetical protein
MVGVVVSTEVVSAVAVSMGVGSRGEASAVALSTVAAFAVTVLVGATGMATGAITNSLMMSSSAATVIRDGGTGAIRTHIMVTAITRTVTMDTADTRTMDTAGTVTTVAPVTDIAMAAEPVTDTAMAADQGISGVCGVADKPATAL